MRRNLNRRRPLDGSLPVAPNREDYSIVITLDPKPIPNYFGSGCHTNFSTKSMREPGGLAAILETMPKLERNHMQHIEKYDLNGGADNVKRLISSFVTAPFDKFSFGIGNRAASVRIPRQVADDGCGYFEDRRPASNIDPYVVAEQMFEKVQPVSDISLYHTKIPSLTLVQITNQN